jgi:hypothetical protein
VESSEELRSEAEVISGYGYQAVSVLLAALVFVAMMSIVYASWRNGISPMPSSVRVRIAAANEVKRLAKYGTIVDAGSGWGTLSLELARHCPGSRMIGIENSPIPLWTSRILARRAGVTFIRGDLYSFPYESADVVVCYLYPGAMKRLDPVLRKRLSPGAHVVSICFALPGWHPERVIACGDTLRTNVYVYAAAGPEDA